MTNSPFTSCRWLAWPAVLWLASPSASQNLVDMGETIAVSAQARGLETIDGVLWASGPHYKASLTAAGMCFTPALGRTSPRARELHFEMLSFGRAEGPTTPAEVVAPYAGDFEVRYVRDGVIESYAVQPTGLEQSFAFDERPRGSGDLVVHGRVRTDLPLVRVADGDLRFVDPEVGGVVIGEVVGIDACGRRIPGAMRCTPDDATGTWELEMSLPAAFVDGARFPLVLDPFFGTVLIPGIGPDDTYTDVAYEATNDVYLFVWDRTYSMFSIDLVAQRFSGAGAPIGGLITLNQNLSGLSRNRVAAVEARDAFVAVWYDGGFQPDVWAASVHAATGAVNGPLKLTSGSADLDPDVGVATDQDDAAIVVWENTALALVRGMRLTVSPGGGLSAGMPRDLSPAGGRFPILSRKGGVSGRLFVAWSAQQTIDGAVFDRNLQVLASGVLFSNPAIPNTAYLDGDGSQWIVAFSGSGNIHGRRIVFDPATAFLTVGPQFAVANQPNVLEEAPCVAWLGTVAAIGFVAVTNMGTPNMSTRVLVATVDGFACTTCAPAVAAVTHAAGWFIANPRLCARPGANGTAAEAMLTCMEGTRSGAMVVAYQFRSDDGLEWDRGGGCGGGFASHGCAVVGNSGYALRLDSAPPLAPAFLLLGTTTADLPCGACTIVPDPTTVAALFVGQTNGSGAASLALAIPPSPSLRGARFFEQWVTADPSGCLGFSASNALEIVVQ